MYIFDGSYAKLCRKFTPKWSNFVAPKKPDLTLTYSIVYDTSIKYKRGFIKLSILYPVPTLHSKHSRRKIRVKKGVNEFGTLANQII